MKLSFEIRFFLFLLNVYFLFSCSKPAANVTYTESIAPIIYKNCTSCHREGSAGPFNLITYQDVKSRSKLIKYSVQSRFMPPFPADVSYSHFIDEKVLTQEEINLITQWVDEGCKFGDSIMFAEPPEFQTGSQLGKPDLIVKLRDVYKINGDGRDKFLLMRVPYEIAQDTFISVIEVVPQNLKLVHHVNAQLMSYDFDKRKDVMEGNVVADIKDYPTILDAYKYLNLQNDDGTFPMLTYSVTNYLPGVTPPIYPNGIGGFKLNRKGALFLKDIHYGPSRVDTSDQTTFNIFYAKQPPQRPTHEFQLGTFGVSPTVPTLVIPPDTIMTFHSDYTVPKDISILTINPHMHLLGKSFLAYALLPAGDTIHLIKINKWDFRWQYFYTFKKMVKIPVGSVIHAEGVYDNTRKNPLNPFSPPQLVAEREGSMRTSDEMFQFIVTYLPYKTGDENISLDTNVK